MEILSQINNVPRNLYLPENTQHSPPQLQAFSFSHNGTMFLLHFLYFLISLCYAAV